jgi:hypothetical protein
MKVALYSETARQHIVAGRSMISEMGYTSSAEDIRQCWQDFIAMQMMVILILKRYLK